MAMSGAVSPDDPRTCAEALEDEITETVELAVEWLLTPRQAAQEIIKRLATGEGE